MKNRSVELILVGYYLSRFGIKQPPSRLNTNKWYEAYRLFYDFLNEGRSVLEFEHSLKNVRDTFDGHFPENTRKGWKNDSGTPIFLTGIANQVFNKYKNKNEEEIWELISKYSPLIINKDQNI